MKRSSRWLFFMIAILIGVGVGLYLAWVKYPADFVDAAFSYLRQDYKTDYVLMTAEIYEQDHVLYQAMVRLDKLSEHSPEEAIANGIRTAEQLGYSERDLEVMRRLENAVKGTKATATQEIDENLLATYNAPLTQTTAGPTVTPDPNLPKADEDPFGNAGSQPTPTADDGWDDFFAPAGG